MSLARVLSRAQLGLEAPLVQVEVHAGRGLPSFNIVGLPAPVVRESRERVRAALLNCGYSFPPGRITVNLAPAELSKQGGRFDLPIALGVLIASGQLGGCGPPPGPECFGELGLDGELKPVAGLLVAALHARRCSHAMLVPSASLEEARFCGHPAVLGAAHLREAVEQLQRPGALRPGPWPAGETAVGRAGAGRDAQPRPGLEDIVGQWQAKRALVIAAAGGHSVLMTGPPGSGKSLLAAKLPGLLPPLSEAETLEVAGIASVGGAPVDTRTCSAPPFRAPHHSASASAIVGGGRWARPGEISLAHRGVLFLDELPEFDRNVLESLREPLETGTITIARAALHVQLPAAFQLIAAMNPCPCGYLGDPVHACRCTPARIGQYRSRISGPLLDRIDIRIVVPRIPAAQLVTVAPQPGDEGEAYARVQAARARRVDRSGCVSARLDAGQLRRCCALPRRSEQLLRHGCERLALSGRGVHRLLALSRTIADLAGSDPIEPEHLAEAIQLRRPI